MVKLIFTALLLMVVTACATVSLIPTNELVYQAIAIQLEHTQEELKQKLDLDFQGFEIKHLAVTQEKSLTIEKLPTYRLRGTYDLVFKLPNRSLTQLEKPYEIYLQLQKEGKSWRLLVPETEKHKIWRSYLIR